MRLAAVLISVVLSAAVFAQTRTGTYRPLSAPAASWSIGPNRTLIWGGQPYQPVGIRTEATPGTFDVLEKAGLRDVMVDLPLRSDQWRSIPAELEAKGFRYVLAVAGRSPASFGYSVEPETFRIANVDKSGRYEIAIPGAKRVYGVLALKADASIQQSKRLPVVNGRVVWDVKIPEGLEHVILVYPELDDLSQPDLWERFDAHRDSLLRCLNALKPQPGLRGILNPLGQYNRPAGRRCVPTSDLFRLEFAAYLESKYKKLDTAIAAWSLRATDISSFLELARLVPLWSGQRGVGELLDPTNDRLYSCEHRRSLVWKDMDEAIGLMLAKRSSRLLEAVRAIVDVPQIQEWSGWGGPYEAGVPISGLGVSMQGSSPSMRYSAAGPAVSSGFRLLQPTWLVLTDLGGLAESSLESALDDAVSLGLRAWYVPLEPGLDLAGVAKENERLSRDGSLSQWTPSPVFFPENAENPAATQRLPAGNLWLPAPIAGNRVDLGAQFAAYRYLEGNQPTFMLWSLQPAARIKLLMANPEKAIFTTLDGVNPNPKRVKGGVEIAISELPMKISGVDEIPVPEPALQETVKQFDAMLEVAEGQRTETTEERFFFKDALNGLDKNPGGSFLILRKQYANLSRKLARYLWVEAEKVQDSTFGEIATLPGCSNGLAVIARGGLAPGLPVSLSFEAPIRTEGDYEAWVAIKFSEVLRPNLRLFVGGKILQVEGSGLSPYAGGFAWYKLGTLSIKPGRIPVQFQTSLLPGTECAIDTILLTPTSFRPNGVSPPPAITFPSSP